MPKNEDFYKDGNRQILERMSVLVDKGLPIDLLTLTDELQKTGILDEVGGAAYLSSLMDGVPKSLNIEYHARIVKEKALLRIAMRGHMLDIQHVGSTALRDFVARAVPDLILEHGDARPLGGLSLAAVSRSAQGLGIVRSRLLAGG